MNTNLKPIMTTREVAQALGLAEQEVRRLEAEGILKRLRGFSCPMKFSGHQILEWLKGEKR
jgi:DNA-binding Lrp family transcriptional regulator